MPARRLLFVNANLLTAYRWLPSGPREEATFAADENGLLAFRDYLRRQPASLFYLLADLAEEGFQVDELPYVQGSDRRELIKRKLAQYYYGTPLSLAIALGRSKKGRRDEKFLFAGLTGVGQIEPWLQVLREAEARLAGIHSMPFVIAALVGKLPSGAAEQLLVISTSSAGLRQSFFENGQLRFSRLTTMATDRHDQVSAACASEASKIYQYLAGQRLISRDKPLRVLVLAHAAQLNDLSRSFADTPERQVETVDIGSLARQHELAEAPTDARGDRLYLHLLMRHTPHLQFAPAEDRRFYRLWQFRYAFNVASAAIFGACLLYAGSQMLRLSELADSNAQAKLDIETGQRRYDDLMRGLPPIEISRDSLRDLTDRYQALIQRSAGPEPLLRHLSQALDRAPRIELTRIEWRLDDGNTRDSRTDATQGQGVAKGSTHATLDLQAQLPAAMAADHRGQLETINAFAGMLSTKNVQVRVLSLPFEQESGKSIRSGDAAVTEPPKFNLRVVQAL
jgi:hypothetical protein